MRPLLIRLVTLFSVAAFGCGFAGCTQSVKESRAPAPTATAVAHAGFLSNYGLLQPDPSDPGLLRYTAPGVARQYHKFLLDPPEFILNTGNSSQVLDPARLQAITAYYRAAMTAALGQHYEVVSDPGPGVARIRVAIVGAVEVNERLKPRNLLPVSALFKVARAATGTNAEVLRLSIESEAVDASTGALLGETVDSRESSKTVLKGEPADAGQVNQLIDFWVQRFVARLDRANGYAADAAR